MHEFEYILKGPTSDIGEFSPNQSLDIATNYESELLFNTDTVDTPFYTGITMFITDNGGNTLMIVNYLENRYIEKQLFGFRLKNKDIFYGIFPRGTLGIALCAIPITLAINS